MGDAIEMHDRKAQASPGGDFDRRVAEAVVALRQAKELVTPDLRVNSRGAAVLMGLSQATLRNWRCRGYGPQCFSAGQTWYRVTTIIRWLDSVENAAA